VEALTDNRNNNNNNKKNPPSVFQGLFFPMRSWWNGRPDCTSCLACCLWTRSGIQQSSSQLLANEMHKIAKSFFPSEDEDQNTQNVKTWTSFNGRKQDKTKHWTCEFLAKLLGALPRGFAHRVSQSLSFWFQVCLHSHCLFGFKSVCLLTPTGASAITGGSCHKYHFCSMLDATEDVFCRDKHVSVTTNTCFWRQIFCRDKNDTYGSSRQW